MKGPINNDKILFFCWNELSSMLSREVQRISLFNAVQIVPVFPLEIPLALRSLGNEEVIGVVLLISEETLYDSQFRSCIQHLLSAVIARPTFRLFVFPVGFSEEEWEKVRNENLTISELWDVVQSPKSSDTDSRIILKAINRHLSELPSINNWVETNKLKKIGGLFASLLNIAVSLSVFIAIFFWVIHSENGLESTWFPWIMFLNGVLLFYSIFMLLSLGTSLEVSRIPRAILAFSFPMWLAHNIPTEKIGETW